MQMRSSCQIQIDEVTSLLGHSRSILWTKTRNRPLQFLTRWPLCPAHTHHSQRRAVALLPSGSQRPYLPGTPRSSAFAHRTVLRYPSARSRSRSMHLYGYSSAFPRIRTNYHYMSQPDDFVRERAQAGLRPTGRTTTVDSRRLRRLGRVA